MTDKFINNMESRYSKMTDEDLIKIVSIDSRDYSAEAIGLAQKELNKRGIDDLIIQSNDKHPLNQINTKIKPPKYFARISLYIIWVVVWLLFYLVYSSSTRYLSMGLFRIFKASGINDIDFISSISGFVHALLYFFLFYILYKGLKSITIDTK